MCTEIQSKHFLLNNTFFPENRAVYEIMQNNTLQQTDHRGQYNTEHTFCMMDDCGYKHTLRIRNNPCFCIARMRRSVMFVPTLPLFFN